MLCVLEDERWVNSVRETCHRHLSVDSSGLNVIDDNLKVGSNKTAQYSREIKSD